MPRESKKTETPIKVNGVLYSSIKEAHMKLCPEIPRVTITARLTIYCWTPEEAFNIVKRDRRKEKGRKKPSHNKKGRARNIKVVIDGVEYASRADACRAFNIRESIVNNRLAQNKKKKGEKWTVETAIKTPVADKSVVINGVKYRSKTAAFYAIGKTTLGEFQYRSREGHSLEYALGLIDNK